MNIHKTIRVKDAVAVLECMAEAASVSEDNNEFIRGIYNAIWQIRNNVPTIEDEGRFDA